MNESIESSAKYFAHLMYEGYSIPTPNFNKDFKDEYIKRMVVESFMWYGNDTPHKCKIEQIIEPYLKQSHKNLTKKELREIVEELYSIGCNKIIN